MTQKIDHMTYLPDMEIIASTMLDEVLQARRAYRPEAYTAGHVRQALQENHLKPEHFAALLSPAAAPFLE